MVRRPPSSEVPDAPGAYQFRDRHGRVLYVGKAKSLRKRLANYFVEDLQPRTRTMVKSAESVDWIVTDSELAALWLEYSLIKEHRPRFNIRLRDDKSFPYLAITSKDKWPRATVMRGKKRKGVDYYGPYAHAYAIRETLDLLIRTFPIRTCTDSKFRSYEALGRPCLLYHIERCSGPCIGAVTGEEYTGYVEGLAAFVSGDSGGVVDSLQTRMREASDAREYELAARMRDQGRAVERALATQEVATEKAEDFDLIAVEEDELEAVLMVLKVRRGRVVGRATTVVDKVEDVTTAGLIHRLVGQIYTDDRPPGQVLVQELPDEPELINQWLEERRGGRVSLRIPQRGAKRRLMETAATNAREQFVRHRLKRAQDHNSRAQALRSLEKWLELPESPLRIECYDISTIQGSSTVASMVVFEDGLPRKSEYRRFRIKSIDGQDDFASMEEVLRRRFSAYLAQRDVPVDERGKFAYPPSLVLIDGGAGQLGRAVKVLDELNLSIPVAGLAKRMEEVYLPGRPAPLQIPRGEEALYLLQRVRDEAHRFAVTFHRQVRGKKMVDSILDGVPGVGPTRKKKLLRRFGSLKRLRAADIDELAEIVPSQVASDLYKVLHSPL